MASVLSVLERFVKLHHALEYAQLEVEPGFALVLSFDEARELYHQLITADNIHYYAPQFGIMGSVHKIDTTGINLPGRPHPPNREHNVWGSILGITIVIKGTEDE